MKKTILFLVLVIIFSCKGQTSDKSITIKKVDEFKTEVLGKEVQLVDVRTAEEYNEGHIDDAINIDFFETDTFAEKFEQFDKNEAIYIYCRSGHRSQKSAKILKELGFNNIVDLEGGYLAWNEEN